MSGLGQLYQKHRTKVWMAQAVLLLGVGVVVGQSMRQSRNVGYQQL